MGAPELLQHLRAAGFAIAPAERGGIRVMPAGALSDADRQAIRDHRAELLALLGGDASPTPRKPTAARNPLPPAAWTEPEITVFNDRYERLLRWGWSEIEAEKLAERLAWRDRDADNRVVCAECRHYRAERCGNHKAAILNVADRGRNLAGLLQRCAGFRAFTEAAPP